MTTEDQQSVCMVTKNTDSQVDTKTDHTYEHSSDQEAMMNILCPDLDSDSDLDEGYCLFVTE